jgi:hypothetical protein
VKVRNCAWVQIDGHAQARVVWARAGIFSTQCPKSIVTAQSMYFLELFRWWKEGGGGLWELQAKAAEAVMVLEQAWRMERERGKT